MVDIVKHRSRYYIRLNNRIPSWQNGFECIEAAQKFIDIHDIEQSQEDKLKYSPDDFEFVTDVYNFKNEGDIWTRRNGNRVVTLRPEDDSITLTIQDKYNSSVYEYDEIDDLMLKLDDIFESHDIFETTELQRRFFIFAASSREIAKNMVRVKSSNIWSYTMNVKSSKDNTGDVYVQFKNKNGGPGDVYVYYNVPIKLWRRWLSAPSKGHFFWQMIRNTFLYSKLTGDKRTHLKNGVSAQKAQNMNSEPEESEQDRV